MSKSKVEDKICLTLRVMIAATLLILGGAVTAQSQDLAKNLPRVTAKVKTSDDADVISQVISSFFQAISAPAGTKLDRVRLQSLFVPGGRIGSVYMPHGNVPSEARFVSPSEYADGSDRFTAKYGFFDHVLYNTIEEYGLMAHVYSAYESRNDPNDVQPMARGIKSIELLKSNGKWFIVQVYWNSETPDNPIPQGFLKP